jgi:hypothetical protein
MKIIKMQYSKKNYYIHKGVLYTQTFPKKWVRHCINGTGPHNCFQCMEHGFWNGVFIGYCKDCALLYQGNRGRGFVSTGVEYYGPNIAYVPSIFSTYMKGIALNNIGDINIVDSASLCMTDEPLYHNDDFDSETYFGYYPSSNDICSLDTSAGYASY